MTVVQHQHTFTVRLAALGVKKPEIVIETKTVEAKKSVEAQFLGRSLSFRALCH
jgi:hypothetical protein